MGMTSIKRHMNAVADLGCILCRHLGYGRTPPELHHPREAAGGAIEDGVGDGGGSGFTNSQVIEVGAWIEGVGAIRIDGEGAGFQRQHDDARALRRPPRRPQLRRVPPVAGSRGAGQKRLVAGKIGLAGWTPPGG